MVNIPLVSAVRMIKVAKKNSETRRQRKLSPNQTYRKPAKPAKKNKRKANCNAWGRTLDTQNMTVPIASRYTPVVGLFCNSSFARAIDRCRKIPVSLYVSLPVGQHKT